MGQRIYYIIAKGDLEVPIDIVSFIEKDATIIPLNIDEFYYRGLSELSEDWKNAEHLYGYIGSDYLDPTKKPFTFIREIKLNNFAILGYREHSDMPQYIGNPIIFIEGKSLNSDNLSFQECHDLLNIDFSYGELLRNEARYGNFDCAEDNYYKMIENLLPKNWYK